MASATGACLCGAVTFVVNGPLRDVIYCHCKQCRRTSGHFVAASACAKADLQLVRDEHLQWFDSSDEARRGFCGRCGSSLFWEPTFKDTMSIMAGALDDSSAVRASHHIFVTDAGAYYSLDDGLPQWEHYEKPEHANGE